MYSYIDAKYTQFIGATGADVSYNECSKIPGNSGNIRATYDWDMPVMGNNSNTQV